MKNYAPTTTSIKILLAILLFVSSYRLEAQQVSNYSFTQNNGTFSPITGGTVHGSGVTLNDNVYSLSIPFSLNFDGVSYNSGFVSVNGFMTLGATSPASTNYNPISASASGFTVMAPFGRNLEAFSTLSEVRSLTTGVAPNRIFTMQWLNMGDVMLSGITLNFQVKLYETSNVVEFVYGNVSTIANTTIAQVGIRGTVNTNYHSRTSTTGWTNTTQSAINTATVSLSTTAFPSSGYRFTFTPPPNCIAPGNQPTNLVLTPTSSTIIGGSFTAAVGADKYLVIRTPNVPFVGTPVNGTVYAAGNTLGNGIVVYSGPNTTFNSNGLTTNGTYTYTVFSYNDQVCLNGPTYNTVSPITGTQQTFGPKKYTWIPTSGSASFATTTNWNPTRYSNQVNDTLVFDNGGNVTVTSVPTQTVTILEVSNSTTVNMVSAATNIFTIGSKLNIAQACSLTISGTLTISHSNTATTGNINGSLIIDNSSVYNVTNGNATVAGNITVVGSGAGVTNACTCAPANMVFNANSMYNHARDGGAIPNATYNTASTVNVTGIVSTSPTFTTGQDLGNFNWNCTGQTIQATLASNVDSVKGTFTVTNSGTNGLKIGNSSSLTMNVNQFVQNGGTFQVCHGGGKIKIYGNAVLNSGTFDVASNVGFNILVVTLLGNLTQNAGHLITHSGTGTPRIGFLGTVTQNVVINGTVANINAINFSLGNPSGAVLTGIIPIAAGASNFVNAGQWYGTGGFLYSNTNTTLTYASSTPLVPTAIEWPATNGPLNLTMDMTGPAPQNQINLPGSRTLSGVFNHLQGILVLNQYDFTIPGSNVNYNVYPDTVTFIAADSTGYFIRNIYLTAQNYYFPIGSVKNNTVNYSPATITMQSNTANRNIGVRLKKAHHPNDLSGTDYIKRYWQFIDNGGAAPYAYTCSLGYRYDDVVGTENFSLNMWNGSSWQQLPSFVQPMGYTVNHYDAALVASSSIQSTTASLNNHDFTARPTVPNVYSWTGATNTNYQVATNWTPNRNLTSASDVLQFNSGFSHLVTNIPAEHSGRIRVYNNTNVTFQSAVNTSTNVYYKLHSDSNPATHELHIENGSSLLINGTAHPLRIGFEGLGSTVLIAGRLEFDNTTWDNCISFDYTAGATVTTTGVLATGTSNYSSAILFPAFLTINGTFEDKYQMGMPILNCNWGNTAVIKILGVTGATSMSGVPAQISKLIYNCPAQTSVCHWVGVIPNVTDSVIVISTGTGEWRWSQSTAYTAQVGHFYMTGGNVNFGPAHPQTNVQFNKSFTQIGGTLSCIPSGANYLTLNFNGTTGAQNVSLLNSSIAGPVNYKVSNANGINLTGTGTLSTNFDINANGAVEVATAAANPINTSLNILYNSTNTSVIYSGAGNITATSAIYPPTNGPQNLSLNLTNGGQVTLPFSRVVPNTLKMTSGDINMGANSLTLGTSQVSFGTLTYTSGFIKVNGGNFTRWFGTTNAPISAGINNGFYPLGNNNSDRSAFLYFNVNTVFANGGTISVGHTNVAGTTTGLSVADGAFTINDRTNSSWNITMGNGISMPSGTAGVKLIAGDLITSTTPANLRLMHAASVVGTHINGSGTLPNFEVNRNLINATDLTSGPFYIGADGGNMSNVWTSITTGPWNVGATWDQGTTPPSTAVVNIAPGTTVTSAASNVGKVLYVQPGGVLTVSSGTLNIGDMVTNEGTTNISGGQLNMGPTGGGKLGFANKGYLNVLGGTLYVNGYFHDSAGAYFSQSGGNVSVDGNAGGVQANSVVNNMSIVYLASPNISLTGGSFTIVDPHTYNFSVSALRVVFNGVVDASTNHTMIFGDGISTDNGLSLRIAPQSNTISRLRFGNVITNGSPSGTGRNVVQSTNTWILGNLTVNNANAVHDISGSVTEIHKDIIVNAGATMYTAGIMNMVKSIGTPQQIGGAGTYRMSSASVINFGSIYVNNNVGGVVVNLGNVSLGGNLNFYSGLFNIGSNNTLTMSGNVQYSDLYSGWIIGKLQRPMSTGNVTYTYHIGDLTRYTPVTVSGTVTTAGSLRVAGTATDHPNINTSPFDPNATTNRHYTIDTSGGIAYTAGSVTLTPYWTYSDVDNGANAADFFPAVYRNSTWTPHTTFTPAYVTSIVTGLGNNIHGAWQFGEVAQTPLITTQPANQSSCIGNNATFSVAANYASSYQWQEYNGSTWANLSNSTTYGGVTSPTLTISNLTLLMNNYQYRCVVTNSAGSTNSNAATLSVSSTLAPTVSVSVVPGTTVCAGTQQTFTAAITNGGTTPLYQWKVNGLNVGTNSSTFVTSTLSNNDIVTCELTSSFACASPLIVASAPLSITVNSGTTSTATVAGNTTICSGTPTTFTATTNITNASYQWQVNGVNAGTNSATYVYSPANNDQVKCIVTNIGTACFTPNSVSSNTLNIVVASSVTPTASVAGNTTVCAGVNTTYTVTTNITGGTYQWQVNGVNVGANSSTYSYIPVNNDQVKCIVSAPIGSCYSPASVTSNTLTIAVMSSVTPTASVAGNTTVCTGVNTTYTATTNIAGGTYQWQVNGVNVGANSATYSYVPVNNDQVKCIVTAPVGSCYVPSSVTSNTLAIIVSSSITPTASVAGNTTVCTGVNTTYTAMTNVTGGTYQWQVNGVNVGANSSTYSYIPVNNDQVKCIVSAPIGSCYSPASVTSNTLTIAVMSSVTPTASVAGNTTVCAGVNTTYTATTNITGGTYQWQVNGVNVGGNSSTYSYVPVNNDQVKCIITAPVGSCYSPASVTSNTLTITVNASTTPTASVAGNSTVCLGAAVTYTATTNVTGGTYQWQVNGVNVGTNSGTYSYTPANGDQVKCIITTPVGSCYTSATVTSNTITMIVNPMVAPTASIAGNTDVCSGSNESYTVATNVTGGAYQWQVNGANVGANSNTYSYNPANGDEVTCSVTVPVGGCFTPSSVTSNQLTINVTTIQTPTISVDASPSPASVGTTIGVTATVANAGTTYSIDWKNNGVTFDVTTVPNTSYIKGVGQDNITADITPTGCYNSASSNTAIVEELLSVKDLDLRNVCAVYPNPFSDKIVVTNLRKSDKIVLFDITGKEIMRWTGMSNDKEQTIIVKDVADGTYLLHIIDASGQIKHTVPVNKISK